MENNTAQFFLSRDIQNSIKTLQKSFFDIVDDLKASDLDNYESLRAILQDDELAKKFLLFQENRTKAIRKKILDSTGDMGRTIQGSLEDYKIEFGDDVEMKGIVK